MEGNIRGKVLLVCRERCSKKKFRLYSFKKLFGRVGEDAQSYRMMALRLAICLKFESFFSFSVCVIPLKWECCRVQSIYHCYHVAVNASILFNTE